MRRRNRFVGDERDFSVVAAGAVEPAEVDCDKSLRGTASQFFVAGELSRRGLVAVVTMGNCPTTDILCSNVEATRFAHIQVKTFRVGSQKCAVGRKAETLRGSQFFWVLVGLSPPSSK